MGVSAEGVEMNVALSQSEADYFSELRKGQNSKSDSGHIKTILPR